MRNATVPRAVIARVQRGAAAVEFALVSGLFLLTLLFGVIELGRAFFYMNSAAQATRLGARMAVVCDKSAAQESLIRTRMEASLNILKPDEIGVEKIGFLYSPDNDCTADGPNVCRFVTVRINPGSTKFDTVIPFVPLRWTVPSFSTTLPRESMSSASDNPVCKPPWTDPAWIAL